VEAHLPADRKFTYLGLLKPIWKISASDVRVFVEITVQISCVLKALRLEFIRL
jgi:hypothetical protein